MTREDPVRAAAQYTLDRLDSMIGGHLSSEARDVSIDMLRAALATSPADGAGVDVDDLGWARAIHDAFHYGPPTLTCMTKHRVKAKKLTRRPRRSLRWDVTNPK